MVGFESGKDEPGMTEADFRADLRALLKRAASNGVAVHGRWQVVSDDSRDAWELEVTDPALRSVIHAPDNDLTIPSITELITVREGVDTTDLPPLHEAVDPDLLDLLYDPDGERPKQYLTFEYADYRITACSDGSVVLEARSE